MTRLTPLLSSLKTLTVTPQTPQETVFTTPPTLPTTEPTTPQISYTVAQTDLPTISIPVYSKKWTALIIGAGQFVTAGTCYWRMKRNGASVNSGSFAVSSNYFYTIHACFYDVNVGDVLELALWSNKTDSNLQYKAYQCGVTRIVPSKKPLYGLVIQDANLYPNLSYGSVAGTDGSPVYFYDRQLNFEMNSGQTYNFPVPFSVGLTYGLYRTKFSDYSWMNTVQTNTNATYCPYYRKSAMPNIIKFRVLNID